MTPTRRSLSMNMEPTDFYRSQKMESWLIAKMLDFFRKYSGMQVPLHINLQKSHQPAFLALRLPPTLSKCPVRNGGGRSSGVEHNLAKVRVESSNLFARSSFVSLLRQIDGAAFGRPFCFQLPTRVGAGTYLYYTAPTPKPELFHEL